MSGLRIDHYDWRGGREAMLWLRPANEPTDRPVVVAALPLLEEANRTRAFVVTILRALAARGVAGALPDLPGQGESVAETADARLADMTEAMAAAVDAIRAAHPRSYAVGVRSGALLDVGAEHDGRWYFAPQEGGSLLRELGRIRGSGLPRDRNIEAEHVEIAGNRLSAALLADLNDAPPLDRPGAVRVVRLATDPAVADRQVEASPLWRRSEPGNDAALADLLAADIVQWIRACEA